MPVTLIKVVFRRVNKSRPPFMETSVKVDTSCSNESSKNLASLIFNAITRKKSVFQYSEDDINDVDMRGGTDICDSLKKTFSRGWGDFIIVNGMISVVVDDNTDLVPSPFHIKVYNEHACSKTKTIGSAQYGPQ